MASKDKGKNRNLAFSTHHFFDELFHHFVLVDLWWAGGKKRNSLSAAQGFHALFPEVLMKNRPLDGEGYGNDVNWK
jgi:hypothetical protein